MILLRLSYAALIGVAAGTMAGAGIETLSVAAFVAWAVVQYMLQAREPLAELGRAIRRITAEKNATSAINMLSSELVDLVAAEVKRSGMDPDKRILLRLDGRDITIHAKKDEA